jgi:hypothetical protein
MIASQNRGHRLNISDDRVTVSVLFPRGFNQASNSGNPLGVLSHALKNTQNQFHCHFCFLSKNGYRKCRTCPVCR